MWSTIAAIGSSGATIVLMALIARLLGGEEYGKVVLLQSSVVSFGVLAGIGVGAAAARYLAALRHTHPERLSNILRLNEWAIVAGGTFVSVSVVVLAGSIASSLLRAPSLERSLQIAAPAILFLTMDGYFKSVLIGCESMRRLAVASILGVLAGAPLLVFGVYCCDTTGYAAALSGSSAIQLFVSRKHATQQLRIALRGARPTRWWTEWRVLLDFALPAFLSSALVGPVHWACYVLLAREEGGLSEVATLNIALQWFNAILFVPAMAGRVILPVITERISRGSRQDAWHVLLSAIVGNLLFVVPIALTISIASRWILSIYGPDYIAGEAVLAQMALVTVLVVAAAPIGHAIAAENRMWVGAGMNFFWAALVFGTATSLVHMGANGIVIAFGFGYAAHALWVFGYARRYTALSEGVLGRTSGNPS